jgi:glycine betaine catabolism B
MTEAIPATARWQSCAIVEVATRTPAIKSFFLRLSETFDYTAGQHVDVRLTAPDGYTAMRSYSIASAPSGSQVIELAIERLADGEVSPFFTMSLKSATRSSFAGRLADTFSGRALPTNQCS